MQETLLQLHLAGHGPEPPARPVDALVAARRHFLRGERVDMQELAAELKVNRATLYRWVGSRELLLGEVLWSLAELGLQEARAAAEGAGVEWMVQYYEHFMRNVAGHEPTKRFVESEPELAMRLLTSKQGVQQGRLIANLEAVLQEKAAAGELKLRVPVADLAYVMVRIAESFIWRDLITGEEPDVHRAADVVRVLLS